MNSLHWMRLVRLHPPIPTHADESSPVWMGLELSLGRQVCLDLQQSCQLQPPLAAGRWSCRVLHQCQGRVARWPIRHWQLEGCSGDHLQPPHRQEMQARGQGQCRPDLRPESVRALHCVAGRSWSWHRHHLKMMAVAAG